jgi:hypothetical protein
MRRYGVLLLAAGTLGSILGCGEKPKYADPVEVRKADENRIRAIENNQNLTRAQKDWQINRIKGQGTPPPRR